MNSINEKNNSRFAFFGTPSMAADILSCLAEKGWIPAVVVTKPDAPVGRRKTMTPSPVKVCAQEMSISVLEPQKLTTEFSHSPFLQDIDFALVIAYGKILPAHLLEKFPSHVLNVHASLLPQYRGASPIQNALLDGMKETGITLMRMETGLDTGPIISQHSLSINTDDTTETLTKRLTQLSCDVLPETLFLWSTHQIQSKPQDEKKATYCHMISKKDGHIDWNNDAQTVYNQYRAYTPWPGVHSFIEYQGKLLRIKWTALTMEKSSPSINNPPGTLMQNASDVLTISCGDGKVLRVISLQMEGKACLSAREWLRGYKHFIGRKLL